MFGELAFEACRTRRGHQRPGPKQPEFGMLPAQQRLNARHRAGRHIILRLVMDRDLISRQRGMDHHSVACRRGPRELVTRCTKLLGDRFALRDQCSGDADRQATVRIADDWFGKRNVQRALLCAKRPERQRRCRNDQEARPVEPVDARPLAELVARKIFQPSPDFVEHRIACCCSSAVVNARHLIDLNQDDTDVGVVPGVQDFEFVGAGGKGFGQAIHCPFLTGFPCQAPAFCTTICPWLSHYPTTPRRRHR